MKKCKHHKYNKDNWEHICTARGCVCRGIKTDQKTCLIAQLEIKSEKYEKILNEFNEHFKNECTSCKEQYYNQHCEDCETQYFLDIIGKAKEE